MLLNKMMKVSNFHKRLRNQMPIQRKPPRTILPNSRKRPKSLKKRLKNLRKKLKKLRRLLKRPLRKPRNPALIPLNRIMKMLKL